MKAYAFVAWDRVEGIYVGSDGNFPKFEVNFGGGKRIIKSNQGSDLYNFWQNGPVEFLVNPKNPKDFYLVHFVDLFMLPIFGIGFGGFFLIGFFFFLPDVPTFENKTNILSSKLPRFFLALNITSLLSLFYSRSFTIIYFFLAYFDPQTYFDKASRLPLVYVLEFILVHSGLFMVVLPEMMKHKGKLASSFSFLFLAMLYLMFVVGMGGKNLNFAFNIYAGVVFSRLVMHFENDPRARSTSLQLSGIGAFLFLFTIFIACIAPIPIMGMTPELESDISNSLNLGSVSVNNLLFCGGLYYLLIFLFELKLIFGKKKENQIDLRQSKRR